ncbi:pyridoxamine 5'-phosphate oxidase family protein [Streptomyces sp. VRA16 Mangrove soil]|uniref:helix-turn-helix domain-containing protein n=1 Tax=Streptomyces sp. VRA16 Mangrove soil TaxID=2817434 RepID=UPI001A9CFFEF|nr:pyridoxamine 5'-phosphate oxidase family protein [Streptomyces sp. VRA16 Mangrove soil]MBO1330750.1 pyridoxamine 5'-phosphate oxidase family protein [Streptomyces sp. VRA16 Mangrove soil]
MPEAAGSDRVTSVQHSDFGRRVATRRQELGLDRQDLAERTGASAAYIAYVEEQAARPATGFVMRLADALGTTAQELRGGTFDRPPGMADGAREPEFLTLTEQECRDLLSTHGVGRIAAQLPRGPVLVPVNYSVTQEGCVAFRTQPGSSIEGMAGKEAAFEVDRVDDAMSEGWSVLLVGTVRPVTDADDARALADLAFTEPWAGGDRNRWLVLTPRQISGRRIRRRPGQG